MFRKINISSILSLFISLNTLGYIEQRESTCSMRNGLCYLENIDTLNTTPTFYLGKERDYMVTGVQFINSKIFQLTSEICEKYEALLNLWADQISMEKIAPSALDKCLKLKTISLTHNFLTDINSYMFNNPELTTLYLSYNKLITINMSIFNQLSNLQILYLDNNLIKLIDLNSLELINNLGYFNIRNNYLDNFEVQNLYQKLPSVKSIALEGNMFECKNLLQMYYTLFQQYNISTIIRPVDFEYKKEHFENAIYFYLNGIQCIFDGKSDKDNQLNTIFDVLRSESPIQTESTDLTWLYVIFGIIASVSFLVTFYWCILLI